MRRLSQVRRTVAPHWACALSAINSFEFASLISGAHDYGSLAGAASSSTNAPQDARRRDNFFSPRRSNGRNDGRGGHRHRGGRGRSGGLRSDTSTQTAMTINLGGGIFIAAPGSESAPVPSRHQVAVSASSSPPTERLPIDAVVPSARPPEGGDVAAQLVDLVCPAREQGTAKWLPTTSEIAAIRHMLLQQQQHASSSDVAATSSSLHHHLVPERTLINITVGIAELEKKCSAAHRTFIDQCTASDTLYLWSLAACLPPPSSLDADSPRLTSSPSHDNHLQATTTLSSLTPRRKVVSSFVQQLCVRTERLLSGMDPQLQAMIFTFASQTGGAPDGLLSRIANELNAKIQQQMNSTAAAEAMQRRRDDAERHHQHSPPAHFTEQVGNESTDAGSTTGGSPHSAVPVAPSSVSSPAVFTKKGGEELTIVLSPTVALVLAATLGAQSGVLHGHFQLHKLFHQLMPFVRQQLQRQSLEVELSSGGGGVSEGPAPPPLAHINTKSLCSIIQGMARYSVGGVELLHEVTAAVSSNIHLLSPNDMIGVLKCLRTIGRPSLHHKPPGARKTDRRASKQRNQRQPQNFQRPLDGVEEDYMPLVEMLMKEGVLPILEHAAASAASTATTSPNISVVTDPHYSRFLVDLYCVNCQLEYPSWGDMYVAIADALTPPIIRDRQQKLTSGGSNSSNDNHHEKDDNNNVHAVQGAGVGGGINNNDKDYLPLNDVLKMVGAILHRNTAVPFHSLHVHLVTTLTRQASEISALHPPPGGFGSVTSPQQSKSRTDVKQHQKIASLACIASMFMLPSTAVIGDSHNDQRTQPVVPSSPGGFVNNLLQNDFTLLTPTAFASALCVAPIQELPPLTRQSLVQHFTQMAPSLGPTWLARGISALLDKISGDVDAVSLHRWTSKVAANGAADAMFLKGMNVLDASTLLRLISTRVIGGGAPPPPPTQAGGGGGGALSVVNDADNTTVALAKQALVHHISNKAESVTPVDMPIVISALCDADLFLPKVFSRFCRALLPHVLEGDLDVVLPAFDKLADLFTSRHYVGSMFEDVWETLRDRCIREAHRMTLQQTIFALTGFARLDVMDRPILLTLSLKVWQHSSELFAAGIAVDSSFSPSLPSHTTTAPPSAGDDGYESKDANEMMLNMIGSDTSEIIHDATAPLETATTAFNGGNNKRHEAAAAAVWSLWASMTIDVQTIVLSLVASASLPSFLFHADSNEPSESATLAAAQQQATMVAVEALLYGVLNQVHDLFPQGLVQLSTAVYGVAANLVTETALATTTTNASSMVDDGVEYNVGRIAVMLHRVMDRCREMLIFIYHTQRNGIIAANADSSDPVWSSKAKRSSMLPPHQFADLIIAIASSGTSDPELVATLLSSCIPPRWLRSPRGIDAHQLVMLTIASCEELSDVNWLTASSAQEDQPATSGEPPSPPLLEVTETNKQKRKRLLTPSLDAVMARMEEISREDLLALRRCLEHHFGAERLDHLLIRKMDEHLEDLQRRRPIVAAHVVAPTKKTVATASTSTVDDDDDDDVPLSRKALIERQQLQNSKHNQTITATTGINALGSGAGSVGEDRLLDMANDHDRYDTFAQRHAEEVGSGDNAAAVGADNDAHHNNDISNKGRASEVPQSETAAEATYFF